MPDAITDLLSELFKAINNLSKAGLLDQFNRLLSRLVRKARNEGMYQVLDYESILELMDVQGRKARFCKREKVRYLQDNIIAFQDQAWGAGKILVDYQCSPGVPVDCYRAGYKIYTLISLREVKKKSDEDEFKINWKIQKGFLRKTGFWGTDINHETDRIKVQVIFPKLRPPLSASILENNRQRTTDLGKDHFRQLPDERWVVTWEVSKPRLYEQYLLCWQW